MAEITPNRFHKLENYKRQNQIDVLGDTPSKKLAEGSTITSEEVALNGQRFITTPVEESLSKDLQVKKGGEKGSVEKPPG